MRKHVSFKFQNNWPRKLNLQFDENWDKSDSDGGEEEEEKKIMVIYIQIGLQQNLNAKLSTKA